MDSVYIFQSTDEKKAFKRALSIGKGEEEEFKNADGETVRWRCKEIISLDRLDGQKLDGAEVYSEPKELGNGEIIAFDTVFHPEKSSPTETH